jgi:hypothetical protein
MEAEISDKPEVALKFKCTCLQKISSVYNSLKNAFKNIAIIHRIIKYLTFETAII